MKVPLGKEDKVASAQATEYASATRTANPALVPLLETLVGVADGLLPEQVYTQYPEIRFIWEFLDMGEHTPSVRAVIDAWLIDEDNMQRVMRLSGRTTRSDNIVNAFGIFRRKPRAEQEWAYLDDHVRPLPKDHPDHGQPQTVVFIAISKLDTGNGFFISLEPGADVIVDYQARIAYPPAGGGLGIAIWLRV